jgi:hypothetical protein
VRVHAASEAGFMIRRAQRRPGQKQSGSNGSQLVVSLPQSLEHDALLSPASHVPSPQ